MAPKRGSGKATAVSDIATRILDPLMQRRAGISVNLLQCWDELAGARLAACSRPERIVWPRRANEDDPFQPATLVIACEGIAALHLQHETGEIISRVNSFLGFGAIGRIRIVQKPVTRDEPRKRPPMRKLAEREERHICELANMIEDEGLRASLERLGRNVLASR